MHHRAARASHASTQGTNSASAVGASAAPAVTSATPPPQQQQQQQPAQGGAHHGPRPTTSSNSDSQKLPVLDNSKLPAHLRASPLAAPTRPSRSPRRTVTSTQAAEKAQAPATAASNVDSNNSLSITGSTQQSYEMMRLQAKLTETRTELDAAQRELRRMQRIEKTQTALVKEINSKLDDTFGDSNMELKRLLELAQHARPKVGGGSPRLEDDQLEQLRRFSIALRLFKELQTLRTREADAADTAADSAAHQPVPPPKPPAAAKSGRRVATRHRRGRSRPPGAATDEETAGETQPEDSPTHTDETEESLGFTMAGEDGAPATQPTLAVETDSQVQPTPPPAQQTPKAAPSPRAPAAPSAPSPRGPTSPTRRQPPARAGSDRSVPASSPRRAAPAPAGAAAATKPVLTTKTKGCKVGNAYCMVSVSVPADPFQASPNTIVAVEAFNVRTNTTWGALTTLGALMGARVVEHAAAALHIDDSDASELTVQSEVADGLVAHRIAARGVALRQAGSLRGDADTDAAWQEEEQEPAVPKIAQATPQSGVLVKRHGQKVGDVYLMISVTASGDGDDMTYVIEAADSDTQDQYIGWIPHAHALGLDGVTDTQPATLARFLIAEKLQLSADATPSRDTPATLQAGKVLLHKSA